VGLLALFLIRFFNQIHSYMFVVFLCLVFAFFLLIASHATNLNNYLVHQIAASCGEDHDHAKNLAQFNTNLAKIFGCLFTALSASLNFMQLPQEALGFTYVFVLLTLLIGLACLLATCLDREWKTPEGKSDPIYFEHAEPNGIFA